MLETVSWAEFAIAQLRRWADQYEVDWDSLARVVAAVQAGGRNSRRHEDLLFQPELYLHGLKRQPWHEASRWDFLAMLKHELHGIQRELASVAGGEMCHDEAATLIERGSWNRYDFYYLGLPIGDALERCPITAAAIARIPGADVLGTYFSIIRPGSLIKPHFGPTNARLTCHLPLIVPEGCGIVVGGETRSWSVGVPVVFDDSYEHYVWNESGVSRVVLLIHFWADGVTSTERAALTYLLRDLRVLTLGADAHITRRPSFYGGTDF